MDKDFIYCMTTPPIISRIPGIHVPPTTPSVSGAPTKIPSLSETRVSQVPVPRSVPSFVTRKPSMTNDEDKVFRVQPSRSPCLVPPSSTFINSATSRPQSVPVQPRLNCGTELQLPKNHRRGVNNCAPSIQYPKIIGASVPKTPRGPPGVNIVSSVAMVSPRIFFPDLSKGSSGRSTSINSSPQSVSLKPKINIITAPMSVPPVLHNSVNPQHNMKYASTPGMHSITNKSTKFLPNFRGATPKCVLQRQKEEDPWLYVPDHDECYVEIEQAFVRPTNILEPEPEIEPETGPMESAIKMASSASIYLSGVKMRDGELHRDNEKRRQAALNMEQISTMIREAQNSLSNTLQEIPAQRGRVTRQTFDKFLDIYENNQEYYREYLENANGSEAVLQIIREQLTILERWFICVVEPRPRNDAKDWAERELRKHKTGYSPYCDPGLMKYIDANITTTSSPQNVAINETISGYLHRLHTELKLIKE